MTGLRTALGAGKVRLGLGLLMILVAVTALFFWDATAHPVFSLVVRQS